MMTIHLQIAEAGKVHMLKGQHQAALERYRAALRLAVSRGDSGVFLQHYTDCILECLEESGDLAQALELTQRALADQRISQGAHARALRASLQQRRILLLFALGREVEGDAALAQVPELGGAVLDAVRQARRRLLHLDARWVAALKRRCLTPVVTDQHLRAADAHLGEALFQKEFNHA